MLARGQSVLISKGGRDSTLAANQVPSLVMEVVTMVEDPTMSVSQLGKVIGSNRALSDRVLRRANSAVLAIPQRVLNVDRAITLLGFDALRDMMLRYFVNTAFRRLVNSVVQYEDFWNHAISCGVASRILARRFAPDCVDGAFVAGLFHDIGFLLLQPETGQAFGPDVTGKGGLSGDMKSHEEIGARLAGQWDLGEEIAEAIRCHHAPGEARLNPPLAATVHIADVLCCKLDIGRSLFDKVETFDPEALAIVHADESTLGLDSIREDALLIRAGVAHAPKFQDLVHAIRRALVDAMGALPGSERLVVALYYQEGLTLAEISRVLGRTEDNIKRLHAAALTALSRVIHDCL